MSPLLKKLTIAIPLYNDVVYIEDTIKSCIGQAGRVVIYDNASTDGSSDIAKKYSEEYEHVHHVRQAENIGAFPNFKMGLDECETEYFSWVGSHDILAENYGSTLLEVAETDQQIALIAGTIKLIDEESAETGEIIRNHWANESKDKDDLDRAGLCATKLRKDCTVFYGVYRTSFLRRVWLDIPSLGWDRALVVRIAAIGKIIYTPKSNFYARNLDKSRDSKTDRERRVNELGSKRIPKDTFVRNKSMIDTVLGLAKTSDDLSRALFYIDKINRRYQNRRYFQRIRLIKIAGVILLLEAIALAFIY